MPMAAPRKAAMVIIDMAEGDRRKIAWGRGCAEEGILLLSKTVGSAVESGIPLVFVADEGHGAMLRELSTAAPGAPFFRKSLMSAFSSSEFRRHLDELNPDVLALAGWAAHLCVRASALDALREGFLVSFSEDLLFHRAGSPPHRMMDETELRLRSPMLIRHPDAHSLLAAIRPAKSV